MPSTLLSPRRHTPWLWCCCCACACIARARSNPSHSSAHPFVGSCALIHSLAEQWRTATPVWLTLSPSGPLARYGGRGPHWMPHVHGAPITLHLSVADVCLPACLPARPIGCSIRNAELVCDAGTPNCSVLSAPLPAGTRRLMSATAWPLPIPQSLLSYSPSCRVFELRACISSPQHAAVCRP